MRLASVLAASSVFLVLLGRATRAEDPPAADAPKPASWTVERVLGDLAVSPDGNWLAVRGSKGISLHPAAGGATVSLDLGDEAGAYHRGYAFTADSKWFVVPGESRSSVRTTDKPDRTQSVFVFTVAAAPKRRVFQLQLTEEKLNKNLRRLAPELNNLRRLEGALMHVVPVAGARVVFDRGAAGAEVWDVATGAKAAAPESLDGPYTCGLSQDGTQSVLTTAKGLEIRDLKTHRVVRTVPCPDYEARTLWPNRPTFTDDAARVLVVCQQPGRSAETSVDCWSVAEAKRLWTAPFADTTVDELWCAGGLAVVKTTSALTFIDLRDGKPVEHELAKKQVDTAALAADRKGVWAASEGTLRRMEMPPLPAK